MKVSGDEVFDELVSAMFADHPDRSITLHDLMSEAERHGIEFDISIVVRSKSHGSVFDREQ
jgi:hypothetical protein